MWGKSAVGGTASKSQGGFFYPLDLIVVVSYFLVVDWCLAKLVAVCLKILAKIVCSGHCHHLADRNYVHYNI